MIVKCNYICMHFCCYSTCKKAWHVLWDEGLILMTLSTISVKSEPYCVHTAACSTTENLVVCIPSPSLAL